MQLNESSFTEHMHESLAIFNKLNINYFTDSEILDNINKLNHKILSFKNITHEMWFPFSAIKSGNLILIILCDF